MKRLLPILTLIALGALACAQDFLVRPSPFAGRTLLTLALFEEVRTEIKTTPDLNTKIDDLKGKLQSDSGEAFQNSNGDFDAAIQAVDKINAKYDVETMKLLSPDQSSRLEQLFVQFNGATAVTNALVAKDLGITDDEQTKIKGVQADSRKKMIEAFQGGGPPDPATMQKLMDEQKAAYDKILTDDQRTKLKTMEGAKFEFKKIAS